MKNEAGFTLVEALISIVLLSIGLLGLLSLLSTAISANRFSYDGTSGVQLAEYMVDIVRLNGGNNNGRYDGMDTSAVIACEADTVDCGPWRAALLNSGLINPIGTVEVTVNSPTDRTDTVEVQVEFGREGVRRSTTLRTILETWRG